MHQKRLLWPALIIGMIAAAVVAYQRYIKISPEEVAELVTRSGVRPLRKALRPMTDGPRILLFALDGVGRDQFRQALRTDGAENLRQLLGVQSDGGYRNAHSFDDAVSILPSTTMAVWASVYSGAPPAQTGVPGNEWFDRRHRQFYAPAPVSVTDTTHTVEMLTDGLVGRSIHAPTLFEIIDRRSFVSLAPVYRGADLFTTPPPESVATVFGDVAVGVTDDRPASHDMYSGIDETSVDSVLDAFREHGIPQLQIVYFPGVDLYTHVASDPLRNQVRYIRSVLDPQIGRVLEQYRAAGLMDRTYVLFVADHGHTPVLNDDRHALGRDEKDEPTELIQRMGFRLRPFVLGPDQGHRDYSAVVAYQGAFAYVYLADRSKCPDAGQECDWSAPPRFEEDVLPLARAFYEASESGKRVPELRGTLDLVFTRRPERPGLRARPFAVVHGSELRRIPDYLRQHPRPDLVRLDERMNWLAEGPYGDHAGDIALLSRSALERPIEDRYYFSGRYHSWHGSPSAQDSRVPFVVAHIGRSANELSKVCGEAVNGAPTVLDITPLVKHLIGVN
jgi:hypothetical protein